MENQAWSQPTTLTGHRSSERYFRPQFFIMDSASDKKKKKVSGGSSMRADWSERILPLSLGAGIPLFGPVWPKLGSEYLWKPLVTVTTQWREGDDMDFPTLGQTRRGSRGTRAAPTWALGSAYLLGTSELQLDSAQEPSVLISTRHQGRSQSPRSLNIIL